MISIGLHAPKKELNLGSYRIYINDLNYYFTQNNINSKIGDETSDVLIYSKSSFPKKIYGRHKKKIGGLFSKALIFLSSLFMNSR